LRSTQQCSGQRRFGRHIFWTWTFWIMASGAYFMERSLPQLTLIWNPWSKPLGRWGEVIQYYSWPDVHYCRAWRRSASAALSIRSKYNILMHQFGPILDFELWNNKKKNWAYLYKKFLLHGVTAHPVQVVHNRKGYIIFVSISRRELWVKKSVFCWPEV
jgi:hypothetical protein